MNVQELVDLLRDHANSRLLLLLPSGSAIPAHFHITEVGRVSKQYIDCGGTRRGSTTCVLQAWTANDIDHRLTAQRLTKIIHLARPVLESFELPVEVEYGTDVAALYTVGEIRIDNDCIAISLVGKQTDCLAKDKCGLEILDGGETCC